MQLEKNRNTKRRNRDEGKAQGHSTAIQAEQSRPVVAGHCQQSTASVIDKYCAVDPFYKRFSRE